MGSENLISFPLFNFETEDLFFEFSTSLTLKRHLYKPSQRDKLFCLAGHEIQSIQEQDFWLFISRNEQNELPEAELANLLLLAFWVFNSTQVQLRYKFEKDGFSRLLDRFQFNKFEKNKNNFSIEDLKIIKNIYGKFVEVTLRRSRLNTALLSTLYGCFASNWRPAVLLYASAFEAILNYSKEPGITKRLGKCFACLMTNDIEKRDFYYSEFVSAYNLRSNVMHGRIIKGNPDQNLRNLAHLANLLRVLWQEIVKNEKLIGRLDAEDKKREQLFAEIINGYVAPQI